MPVLHPRETEERSVPFTNDDDDGLDERLDGARLAELSGAFDRVRDPRDWQAPIHSEIAAAERPLVERAVRLFTDTHPVFEPSPDAADRLVVRAPGYRLGAERRAAHAGPDRRTSTQDRSIR